MSNDNVKKPPAGAATPPAAPGSPEAEVAARVQMLRDNVKGLEAEVKILEGRVTLRNPAIVDMMEKENQEMRERVARLEQALLALTTETLNARQIIDLKTQTEILRLGAVEYCKRANINPEIWKNIVS